MDEALQRWKFLLEEWEKLTFLQQPLCQSSLYIVVYSLWAIAQSLG